MIFHLLIVDDEAPIRKGLSKFIDWAAIDCTIEDTASDGLEAMEKLKNHPIDIVITDIRMPEADGLELARHIHERYPDVKVIILTGYADFSYAQTAIQYDVSDFLLKPISKEQVISAVQNAQKKLIDARRHHHMQQEDLSFLIEQLLQELTDRPFGDSLQKRMDEYQVDLNRYFIAAFQMFSPTGNIPALKDLVSGQMPGHSYRYNSLVLCAFPVDTEVSQVPEEILSVSHDIIHMTGSMFGIGLSVGFSTVHHGGGEYRNAVSEAIHALTRNFYAPSGIACHDGGLPSSPDNFLTVKEALTLNELESAIVSRDFAAAEAVINSVFMRMKSEFAKSADVRNMCHMIYYVGVRVLVKKCRLAPDSSTADRIERATDIFELESVIRDFLAFLKKKLEEERNYSRIVRHAMNYIDHNLSAPLSLDQIAGEIPTSSSYLSRTFKKETGQALTEYINMARIEKAKELLADNTLLNYEIAEQTGFHDPAYFSSIFKKYTGMSPKEYRSSIGVPAGLPTEDSTIPRT